jgi:hypothetical protein
MILSVFTMLLLSYMVYSWLIILYILASCSISHCMYMYRVSEEQKSIFLAVGHSVLFYVCMFILRTVSALELFDCTRRVGQRERERERDKTNI